MVWLYFRFSLMFPRHRGTDGQAEHHRYLNLPTSSGVVIKPQSKENIDYARDGRCRHFLNLDDLIEPQNGSAAVSNQWCIGNIFDCGAGPIAHSLFHKRKIYVKLHI